MSTAAHEPRRVGRRRPDSPAGSKVTPRRNPPESGETHGLQYDSDELPVLIRLPNLRDLSSSEPRSASATPKTNRRIDRASEGNRKSSKHNEAKVSKRSFQQQAGDNKLVLGGIVGGILVVVLLFLFNARRSTPPTAPDAWVSDAAKLGSPLQEPEVSTPTEIAPPPPLPGFAYDATRTETARIGSGENEKPSLDAPDSTMHAPEVAASEQSKTAAVPSKQPNTTWPPAELMGSQSPTGATPAGGWPDAIMNVEQGENEYLPEDSSSQADYRSSIDPSDADSYRMGKLQTDRPKAAPGDHSSILDGNIEIPDTKSF